MTGRGDEHRVRAVRLEIAQRLEGYLPDACGIVPPMAKAVRAMSWVAALLFVCSRTIAFQGPLLTPRSPASHVLGGTPPVSIRVDASLVLIPVHVTTADGASVTNLPKGS